MFSLLECKKRKPKLNLMVNAKFVQKKLINISQKDLSVVLINHGP